MPSPQTAVIQARTTAHTEAPIRGPVNDESSRFRTLRVAIVSDATSGRNGVGTYYADLIYHLRHKVQIAELIAPEQSPDRAVERFSIPMPGDRTQRMAWPRISALYERLDAISPSIIIVPSIGAYSFFALQYARRRKIPVAIVNHTNFDNLLSLYWPNWATAPVRYALKSANRWLCKRASGVAAMNADALAEATSAGAKFTRVIGTPLGQEFTASARRPVSREITECLFVGRLAEEKGIRSLLQAARKLPELQFRIAGDGPLRPAVLAAQARLENVSYLGWISRSQCVEALDSAQVLVLPSRYETFGTVALEALARKRFVLLSRTCGIADWPTFQQGIFYIEQDQSIAEALTGLCRQSHTHRCQVAERGWDSVQTFHKHTTRVWLRFLSDVASIRPQKAK